MSVWAMNLFVIFFTISHGINFSIKKLDLRIKLQFVFSSFNTLIKDTTSDLGSINLLIVLHWVVT